MKYPMLSVVIPNFNNEKYLRKCIDSVLEQIYMPIEVVIVDDCSTDHSRDVICEYEKKYENVKGIFLNQNQGVSHARNIGLKAAQGEYVTSLDADDFYFSKTKLQGEMELLLANEQSEERGRIVFSPIVAVDTQGQVLWNYKTRNQYCGKDLARAIFSRTSFQLPRDYCYHKKWFVLTNGYVEGMNLYEDIDYLLRLSEVCDFFCTNQIGTAYRISFKGLSSASQEKHKIAQSFIRGKYHYMFSEMEWRKLNFLHTLVIVKGHLKKACKWILRRLKCKN